MQGELHYTSYLEEGYARHFPGASRGRPVDETSETVPTRGHLGLRSGSLGVTPLVSRGPCIQIRPGQTLIITVSPSRPPSHSVTEDLSLDSTECTAKKGVGR